MIPPRRWVVDTNALISRLLLPTSVSAHAVQKALSSGDLIVSDATLQELADVLGRPKFNKYLSPEERREFFQLLSRVAIRIEVLRPIKACRDPKDDKFLELAINGRADAIITGDEDLLVLHPFLGIPILSPKSFLDQM
ncbi:putative toxin-antitoxin system toxin component, PIN family [Terrimicrobium sacchariphilum]|uniref:Putative toxin-antitoxin system toxin component, PIN family n=1 Tax=Terrimicrobium sacchariphilum TaxID=690879 RepID=A0A146GBP6_TERSA|nr:putative toxin-antitoxin system toxin component, PIN family [Terrimicrobium sacchariphilum]GAT34791.1 putative toxin-antitoxin system toxin component, PIN family [Terrimicrobium sacchariphilum]